MPVTLTWLSGASGTPAEFVSTALLGLPGPVTEGVGIGPLFSLLPWDGDSSCSVLLHVTACEHSSVAVQARLRHEQTWCTEAAASGQSQDQHRQ